jgi:uncharacterized membrane protein
MKRLVLKTTPNQRVREISTKETSLPLISYLESHYKSISDYIINVIVISLISITFGSISTSMKAKETKEKRVITSPSRVPTLL